MQIYNNKNKGFTIIELLLVVVLAGLIGATAIMTYSKKLEMAKAKQLALSISQIKEVTQKSASIFYGGNTSGGASANFYANYSPSCPSSITCSAVSISKGTVDMGNIISSAGTTSGIDRSLISGGQIVLKGKKPITTYVSSVNVSPLVTNFQIGLSNVDKNECLGITTLLSNYDTITVHGTVLTPSSSIGAFLNACNLTTTTTQTVVTNGASAVRNVDVLISFKALKTQFSDDVISLENN